MPQKKRYSVLSAFTTHELEMLVNQALDQGAEVVGGVSVVISQGGSYYYYQSVVYILESPSKDE